MSGLTDMVIMPGADYQTACDAIREKTGSTGAIKSGDMAGRIRGISAGGGDLDALIDGTITEVESDIKYVRMQAFRWCTQLKKVSLPNAINIDEDAFNRCTSLSEVNVPAARAVGYDAFYCCLELVSLTLPEVTEIHANAFFESGLTSLTLPGRVCDLMSTNAFSLTPIANGEGYIYVPANLVDTYRSATNWSVYADQIVAIPEGGV